MKALIGIDFISLRKTLLLSLVLGIFVCTASIYNDKIYIVAPACAYLALSLISISYMTDCKVNFQQYLFAIPVRQKEYIFSKLIYAFISGVLGAGLTLGYFIVKHTVALDLAVLISLAILLLIIIFSTFQLIFFIKYGAEKGRLIMVITYLLFFGAIALFKEYGSWMSYLFNKIAAAANWLLGIGILLCGSIIILLLVKTAIRIMGNKEY